jgi:hypothetical protein
MVALAIQTPNMGYFPTKSGDAMTISTIAGIPEKS